MNREWEAEPDKVVWVDDATGLDCMVHRGPAGALCGYVGVPEGHPWFGVDYMRPVGAVDVLMDWDDEFALTPCGAISVHGGLTYSDHCQGDICHQPQPGRPEKVWWFGFDCAHAGDLVPGLVEVWAEAGLGIDSETYKNIAFVKREVEHLAQQLAEVK